MFNTTHRHYGGTRRVEVTKHEHRAPSDDSIRLADEMRRRTIDSVVASGAAPFDAHVTWHFIDDPWNMEIQLVGEFKLNERSHKLNVRLPTLKCRACLSEEEHMRNLPAMILKAISEQLAHALTEDLIRTHHTRLA